MREMIINTKPPGVEVPHPELAYKPRKRTPKVICEHGKRRKIYMPEIYEQWLHHIIVQVLEPIIRATAYRFSCGSFPKRGAHFGKKQIEKWLRSDPKGTRNFAKIDISMVTFSALLAVDVCIVVFFLCRKYSGIGRHNLRMNQICVNGFLNDRSCLRNQTDWAFNGKWENQPYRNECPEYAGDPPWGLFQ